MQKVKSLNAKGLDVLPKNYRPEIDISEKLGAQEASYFQSLIMILQWVVELGRVDICTETSMISYHLALLRNGHLESSFHMLFYLKKHHNSGMMFDPTEPGVYMADFQCECWGLSIYGDVKE